MVEEGGSFVAKVFRGRDVGKLYELLLTMFEEVYCAKPKASRNSSYEAFVVAKGFKSKKEEMFQSHLLSFNAEEEKVSARIILIIIYLGRVKFVSCGGEDAYDSDKNYTLELEGEKYEPREPTQSPINPPYKEYFQLFKK